MSKATDWLEKLKKKKAHFINHDALHCPKEGGFNDGVYYYTEESIIKERNKKLIRFCSMCGKSFPKGITKKVNDFTVIIE